MCTQVQQEIKWALENPEDPKSEKILEENCIKEAFEKIKQTSKFQERYRIEKILNNQNIKYKEGIFNYNEKKKL